MIIALSSLMLSYASLLASEAGAEELGMIFAIFAGLVPCLYFFG